MFQSNSLPSSLPELPAPPLKRQKWKVFWRTAYRYRLRLLGWERTESGDRGQQLQPTCQLTVQQSRQLLQQFLQYALQPCWSFVKTTSQHLATVEDFRMIFERDPAARNGLEVLLCYPGFHALVCHRLAHWLHLRHIPLIPRLISHLARLFTGVEIHPGAVIGKGVCIDHGMGVVIGETAIVGDYCLIYQGVTLGGTGKEIGKRHPTLGSHVVVGAGAKVLGNIYVGDRVRIGAGAVVLRDVPSSCTVVGIPGRTICPIRPEVCPRDQALEHGKVPDVEATIIRQLTDRIEQLERQLALLHLYAPSSRLTQDTMTPLQHPPAAWVAATDALITTSTANSAQNSVHSGGSDESAPP